MIRWGLFAVLAIGVVAYSFWLYLRVELSVPGARRLATARAVALLVLLLLLFDVRVPPMGAAGAPTRWVLLDASLSMSALAAGGSAAWEAASRRAEELEAEGWTVVTFGFRTATPEALEEAEPLELRSLLAPALERAVEAGVGRVRVLSDLRFEDLVAVRSALAALPLNVEFERYGGGLVNAGVSSLRVPDLARPEGSVTAEVEVHGGLEGDSLTVQVLEEERPVAEVRVEAPSPGLTARVPVELPTPNATGLVRYTARVALDGDAFRSDDAVVAYSRVGAEEGAIVLLSLRPDWEPRFLLPVMEDVTGLTGRGYVRAGSDSFVAMGRAVDRSGPVDSATVRGAVESAAVVVFQGLGETADAWARSLTARPGPGLFLVGDAEGAALVGVPTSDPRAGEWYVSSEIPSSPIAGALAGVTFQGLPPLSDLLLPNDPGLVRGALLVQLRGSGPLEAALHLDDRPEGRRAIALGSGFWRWAARDRGREAYRRLWSGVAGWLLAGDAVATVDPRPAEWVVARGDPVTWNLPADSVPRHIVVTPAAADSVVVDTTVVGTQTLVTRPLPPRQYAYRVDGPPTDTVRGRFDVAAATREMVPTPEEPEAAEGTDRSVESPEEVPGRPLRTWPWPYLLVITLLCAEWIGRRRSGLR